MLRDHCKEGTERIVRIIESGVFCEIMSPRNVEATSIKSRQKKYINMT